MENAARVVGLCERFHCLPTDLMAQPASFLRQVEIVDTLRAGNGMG